jgi:hypothetical protein
MQFARVASNLVSTQPRKRKLSFIVSLQFHITSLSFSLRKSNDNSDVYSYFRW